MPVAKSLAPELGVPKVPLSPLFPVQLHTQWSSASEHILTAPLRDWLLDPTSLTARLKAHSQTFKVVVLGQRIEPCSKQDACDIILEDSQVLAREVVLYCDDVPQVFARSILPISSLTGEEQALAHLGDQPLGQVIFSKPNLIRTAIEIGAFDAKSTVTSLAKQITSVERDILWGRRSLFHVEGKPFVVAEVFLPEAYVYQERGVE